MSKLEKIIFIADCTEEYRNYPGVDKIRSIAKNDLDEAMIEAMTSSLIYVLSKKLLVHPQSIHTYNILIRKRESKTNNE